MPTAAAAAERFVATPSASPSLSRRCNRPELSSIAFASERGAGGAFRSLQQQAFAAVTAFALHTARFMSHRDLHTAIARRGGEAQRCWTAAMPVALLDAELVHGQDGWTTLKHARPQPMLNSSTSSSCEQQHKPAEVDRMRAAANAPQACLSAPRAGGARRAGGVRLRDDLFVVGPQILTRWCRSCARTRRAPHPAPPRRRCATRRARPRRWPRRCRSRRSSSLARTPSGCL